MRKKQILNIGIQGYSVFIVNIEKNNTKPNKRCERSGIEVPSYRRGYKIGDRNPLLQKNI